MNSSPADPVDFTRRFIPEDFTPLFHTPVYATLPGAARRRYNQLYACYFNEQVAFFEQEMLSPALDALLAKAALPEPLLRAARTFHAEEQRHTAMFRALNRRCAPELYGRGDDHFIALAAPVRAALRGFSGLPAALPLLLWLSLLQEERSIYYSKRCLDEASVLEPHFVVLHRAHLADEVGHVGWDEELLDWLWPRLGSLRRATTARLFAWTVREFFLLPKRAGQRVTARLAREFPALDAPALFRAMRGLEDDGAYRQTLYSRRIVPRTFARFDAHPEFALLARSLSGYPVTGCPA